MLFLESLLHSLLAVRRQEEVMNSYGRFVAIFFISMILVPAVSGADFGVRAGRYNDESF
jgi:hypothetical protein